MPKYAAKMKEMISETIRTNICRAGIELIREDGWNAFTTEKIAVRAGISRGVLYNYFENIEAVAFEIIKKSLEDQTARLEKILNGPAPAAERLFRMAKLTVNDFLNQRELHRTFMENIPPPPLSAEESNIGSLHDRRDEMFAKVIQAGIESGEFHRTDISTAVTLLCGGLHHLCMQSISGRSIPEVRNIVKLYLQGLEK